VGWSARDASARAGVPFRVHVAHMLARRFDRKEGTVPIGDRVRKPAHV